MNLAMSAAPFDEDNNDNNSNSTINKKRTSMHNKTQKKYSTQHVDTEKVNNVLQSIHNYSNNDDDSNNLGDFTPPAPPVSSGVQKTIDPIQNINNQPQNLDSSINTLGRTSSMAEENSDDKLELNNFDNNYGSKITTEEYYKRYIPNYQSDSATSTPGPINKPYYNSYYTQPQQGGNDNNVLIEKLNYMIHLLEEQQDERTGSVTEEVVLYSFLGIFVIFLVDSFSRIGKYKR